MTVYLRSPDRTCLKVAPGWSEVHKWIYWTSKFQLNFYPAKFRHCALRRISCSQFAAHCGKPVLNLWAHFSVIFWKIWTSSLVLSSRALCHHFHIRYHREKVTILLLVVLWGSISVLYSRLCLKCRNKTLNKLWWSVCCGYIHQYKRYTQLVIIFLFKLE